MVSGVSMLLAQNTIADLLGISSLDSKISGENRSLILLNSRKTPLLICWVYRLLTVLGRTSFTDFLNNYTEV